MKNYRAEGKNITVAAPYAVSSGGGALVGAFFGVAMTDALNGAEVTLVREGQFVLPKTAAQAWTAWTTKLYWDNATKALTTTAGANVFVGYAAVSALAADTTGEAFLHGQLV